jgi:hypothetical protein
VTVAYNDGEEDATMPLRDHFRPPLDNLRHWEGFHGQWPSTIVTALNQTLPQRYFAEPRVHPSTSNEIDITTFEEGETVALSNGREEEEGGGVATAVWAPPRPTLRVATDFPAGPEYEVQVFDQKRQCRLVAAIEIVSPANKDRPDSRRAFVVKCAALLQNRVSVVIVDPVTTRHFNLYADLLDLIGQTDPALGTPPSPIYAVACRATKEGQSWALETWLETLAIDQTLPTMPLWLADDLAVPLELESSYEQTCRNLRIR